MGIENTVRSTARLAAAAALSVLLAAPQALADETMGKVIDVEKALKGGKTVQPGGGTAGGGQTARQPQAGQKQPRQPQDGPPQGGGGDDGEAFGVERPAPEGPDPYGPEGGDGARRGGGPPARSE